MGRTANEWPVMARRSAAVSPVRGPMAYYKPSREGHCSASYKKFPLQVMAPHPATLGPQTPYGHALLLMHERRFRHVPVVEGTRVLGMVSARNAMDPDLEEFVAEARRREHYRTSN